MFMYMNNTTNTTTNRTNRYAGDCWICGGNVAAQAGRLIRSGARWTVAHVDNNVCNEVSEAGDSPA